MQESLLLYQEVVSFLNKKFPNNYLATIIEFHHLSFNFIAALIQFGHHSRQPELCMQTAEDIHQSVGHLSVAEMNGRQIVMQTGWREQIVRAMTVTACLTRTRNYQYLLNLMDELARYLCMPSGNNSTSALNYVEASVQLAHGFKSQEDYNAFQTIYERCIECFQKFANQKMASVLGMIHIQLHRNNVEYYTNEDRQQFLGAAVSLAEKFPEDEANLLRPVLEATSNAYRNSMNNKEFEVASQYFETALSLIQKCNHVEYNTYRKIQCGALIKTSINAYLEDNSFLEHIERGMQIIQDSSAVTFEACLQQVSNEVYNRARTSINQGKIEFFERCKTCLKLLLPYVSCIPQLLEALPDI